jgi:hypothetical protein
MIFIGTILDTNEISANEIDRDPFLEPLNHNNSVINEMTMNDINRDHFGNKSQSLTEMASFVYKPH